MKRVFILCFIAIIIMANAAGCIKETKADKNNIQWYELVHTPKENLQSGMFYVKTVSAGTEVEGTNILPAGIELFYAPYFGAATFDYGSVSKSSAKRMFKLTDDVSKIPVLYKGDSLVYVNNKYPLLEIAWERFEDLGYTIGMSEIVVNATGRCQLRTGSKTLLRTCSIGQVLANVPDNIDIVIENFGGSRLTGEQISRAGSILNLTKGEIYASDIYIGTTHYAIETVADVRLFVSYEDFKTTEYEYTSNGYIEITIPPALKPGYYMINGLGLICYAGEATKERGIEGIDFNEGIVFEEEF